MVALTVICKTWVGGGSKKNLYFFSYEFKFLAFADYLKNIWVVGNF